MRIAPAIVVALLVSLYASADTESWIRAQRRLAADQREANEIAEATETLRLSIVAARRDRLHGEAAQCLRDLAEIRNGVESEAAAAGTETTQLAGLLMKDAAREAAAAGDVVLESQCLALLEGMPTEDDDSDGPNLAAMDAAIVARNFDWLNGEVFFERDVHVAFDAMDAIATAALQERASNLVGAANTLDAAIAAAEKGGLSLTPATLRFDSARLRLAAGNAPVEAIVASLRTSLAFFESRNCAYRRCWTRIWLAQATNSRDVLKQALLDAREEGDAGLEATVLLALVRGADGAEKDALLSAVDEAQNRCHWAALDRARDAAAECETDRETAAELVVAAVRYPEDAPEAKLLRASLGFGDPLPRRELPAALHDHLKALLEGDSAFAGYAALELLRIHDAWPLVAELAPKSKRPDVGLCAFETLATHDDIAALFGFLTSEDADLASTAAAAIFRLATDADIPAVREALEKGPAPGVALYLLGVIARTGDAKALKSLQDALALDDPDMRWHAAVILGRLGFASPITRLGSENSPASPITRLRVVGRAPAEWGASIALDAVGEDGASWMASRANNVRGVRDRVLGLDEENNVWALMYRLPRTPEETRLCGTGWVSRIDDEIWNDASGDTLRWVTEGLGEDFFDGEGALKKRAGNPVADFALEDLEFRRFGAIAGAQTRVLTIGDASAWATLRVTAVPREGEIVDNALKLPFQVKWHTTAGNNGSLAGAIGAVAISIQLATLFPEAEVRIPGFPPIPAEVGVIGEDLVLITAPLPVSKEGEGLETGKLIPLEKIAAGTVTLKIKVDPARASMTFPLAFVVPPKKDKPDLVAAELIVEPHLPKPGEECSLTLRARNIGKTVEKGGVLSVRYSVLNPQNGEGKRTIDVRLFDSDGWRPGEWRTFEARPQAVQDWYMNKYAMSWTLEMGDTRLSAKIDADDKLVEDKEDNNVRELAVPLQVSDEEGKQAAEDELLARLADVLEKVRGAQTEMDARVMIGVMRTWIGKAQLATPATDVACRHLEAAVEMQVERVRVSAALKQVVELAKDPSTNKTKLAAIHAELVSAQTSLLDSGVPVTGDTLTFWRNRVQATANVTGSAGEYGELSGIVHGNHGETPEKVRKVGEAINRLDGALQLMRYARDRVKRGEADTGDAIEGMVSIAGSAPGMSKLHQAMLQAEIDYVDKGFRKEANALDAIGDLIEGKPGAQERLDAAVKDVDGHVRGGPFNEAARKNIILGAAKDVPVLGKLVDMIVSWK